MGNGPGASLQWFQLIATVVGMITILIQIGTKQGKQEEKNRNFENTITRQGEKIDNMERDISEIKTSVSYIKGKLEGK